MSSPSTADKAGDKSSSSEGDKTAINNESSSNKTFASIFDTSNGKASKGSSTSNKTYASVIVQNEKAAVEDTTNKTNKRNSRGIKVDNTLRTGKLKWVE